ncbi:MAG: helix-turn-helix domain-containing protein [Deltaproteobacteria bacterium]|nr:helix-turn-helix domain-containing protein [Deltaproteobacteria bacterium]
MYIKVHLKEYIDEHKGVFGVLREYEGNSIYSIEAAASKLGVHKRTVLRFISQNKLKANKVGRQWRIRENDLLKLLGENEPVKKIVASSVVDIPVASRADADRLQNTFIAALNSRHGNQTNHRVDFIFNPDELYVRFTIWGSVTFMKDFYTLLENIT